MKFGLGNLSDAGDVPNDLEALYLSGLGAVVPQVRFALTSGGAYAPAGTGGGGGGGGETPIAPSTGPGQAGSSGLGPAGRSSSFVRRGRLQTSWQPTQQGARVSAGRSATQISAIRRYEGNAFPSGGLFGLAGLEGVDGLWGWFKTRLRRRRRSSAPPPPAPQSYPPGPGYHPTGVGDLGASWLQKRLTPPQKKLGLVQIIPTNLRRQVPKPLRQIVHYAGLPLAVSQTVLLPFLTGTQQRRLWGLSPGESRVFMKGQQVFRVVDSIVLTMGMSKLAYLAYLGSSTGATALDVIKAGQIPAASLNVSSPAPLSLFPTNATTGFIPAGASFPLGVPAGYATPGQIGAAAAAFSPESAAASLNFLPQTVPFTPAGASLPPGYATAGQIAGSAAKPAAAAATKAAGESIFREAGREAWSVAKWAGRTVGESAASVAVARALQGGGGSELGPMGEALPASWGYGSSPAAPGYDGSAQLPGGGYSSAGPESYPDPQLASVSPAVVIAGAGLAAAAALVVFRRKKRRKS